MLQTVEAEVSVDGSVRLLEPLPINYPSRALVTLLDSGNGSSGGAASTHSSAQGKAAARVFDKRVPPIIPNADFSQSVCWLAEHCEEYAGQWVALDGDHLIAHGLDAKAVYAAADASGVKYPMVTQIEAADALPYAGF